MRSQQCYPMSGVPSPSTLYRAIWALLAERTLRGCDLDSGLLARAGERSARRRVAESSRDAARVAQSCTLWRETRIVEQSLSSGQMVYSRTIGQPWTCKSAWNDSAS